MFELPIVMYKSLPAGDFLNKVNIDFKNLSISYWCDVMPVSKSPWIECRPQLPTLKSGQWLCFSLCIDLIRDIPINIMVIHSKHFHSWFIKIFDSIDYFTRQDIDAWTKSKAGISVSCRNSCWINIVETDNNVRLNFV